MSGIYFKPISSESNLRGWGPGISILSIVPQVILCAAQVETPVLGWFSNRWIGIFPSIMQPHLGDKWYGHFTRGQSILGYLSWYVGHRHLTYLTHSGHCSHVSELPEVSYQRLKNMAWGLKRATDKGERDRVVRGNLRLKERETSKKKRQRQAGGGVQRSSRK